MPRALLLAAVVLLCACVATPANAARQSIKKSLWGPVEVDGTSQFPIYEELGVGIWQYTVRWDQVAPTRPMDPGNPQDPAYAWPAELDRAVDEARDHGIQVSILLIGAPAWANGGREWFWAPDRPGDFADFAAAASERYPTIHHWMIWGEPTKGANFQPLAPDDGKPLRTRAQFEGPRRYADILDASYGALKRVSSRNRVIGGNTFTVGTVAPLRFIRALRTSKGKRPRMDLFGHNPFSQRKPDLDQPPLGSGFADFSDLDTLARTLDKAYRRAPSRKMRHLKIFISEITYPTDHANHEFNFFMSRRTQARFLRAALRITRTYGRIYTLGYLGLYDDPPRPGGDQVERGLITRDGTRKPAYRAFRRG